ncbi:Fosfomycin resistance protein FosX [Pseudodesulfovibrio hydrargyri]|uniref:Fosfomycin resistance protein FosX n=1 Tax=Pseudodesulfovibrio hydrargyri TaxID=2125990 RepID=A0A1J5N5L8_9BACT|nr:Fosfomycin resistance protein FosX [Pseudodesulfovibrio hydrargyri]
MIEGLSHVTFIVRDLDRMEAFLRAVFEAERVYDSGPDTHSLSRERFFVIGGVWVAVMRGDPLREPTYNHVAFKIPDSEFTAYERRVREHGVEVRTGRSRMDG